MTRMHNIHLIALELLILMLTLTTFVGSPQAGESDTTHTVNSIETSFAWRDAFLPPGVPTVAVRSDETALIWNPAGMAFSRVYYLGYAWKGTYYEGDHQASTHFVLAKAAGFGLGYVRDTYSEGVKNQALLSLAPHISNYLALGWTGKWKGGFNFDVGTMLRLGPKITLGVIARDLRERDNARRYWEGGLALAATRSLLLHYDVIVEDSSWRNATAHGGGFYANLRSGVSFGASFFADGDGNTIIRGTLKLRMPSNIIDSEYSNSSDDWQTLGVRLSSQSP